MGYNSRKTKKQTREGIIPVNLRRLPFMGKISECPVVLSPQGAKDSSGSGPLIIEAPLSLSNAQQSIGLLWTGDQLETETST
jgi:hypothetical protein